MTLQQLEYLVAVDRHRHFGKAASHCFVAQPSLSMQIKKLEEELNITIFSRNNYPVTPTEAGILLIEQAKKILYEATTMQDIVQHYTTVAAGNLRIAIIPTLAPYLLPLFLDEFIKKYPGIKISLSELTTDRIIKRLRNGTLDAGILATPLFEKDLQEYPLFNEEFVAYVSRKDSLFTKKYLLPTDIDINKLWLLEEGHCLRNQVMNFCELQKNAAYEKHFDYETGSIETLKRLVEKNAGITILPELASIDLHSSKKQMLRYFKSPAPSRQISMVTLNTFSKKKLVDLMAQEIKDNLPPEINSKKKLLTIRIE